MTAKYEVWLSQEKIVIIKAEDLEQAYEIAEAKFHLTKWNLDKVQPLV
jgi:hypothetical protein